MQNIIKNKKWNKVCFQKLLFEKRKRNENNQLKVGGLIPVVGTSFLKNNGVWRVAVAWGESGCVSAPMVHLATGSALELMELPLGCFSPQMGTAGGDPPPSAVVLSSPFPHPSFPPIASQPCCATGSPLLVCYTALTPDRGGGGGDQTT